MLPRQSKSVDAPNDYTGRRVDTGSTRLSDRVSVTENASSFTQLNQYLLKDEIGKVQTLASVFKSGGRMGMKFQS